ncbi:MAG: DHH family phosphoesterase, partial [Candidatus Micrarchaeota archaeon]
MKQTQLDFEGHDEEEFEASESAPEKKKDDYGPFLAKAREIGDLVLGFDEVIVAHDYDCDGITSAAIVCSAMRAKGKKFETRVLMKKVNDVIMQELVKQGKQLVFCDVGAGQLPVIKKHAPDSIIIDHHPPAAEHELMINPVSFGI